MASIKFTIKKTPNKDGKHSIVLVLIKNRRNTSMATNYSCDYEAWSFETNTLKTNKKGQELKRIIEINNFISKTNLKIEDFIREKRRLNEDFTITEISNEIKADDVTKAVTLDYFKFHQEIIDEFQLADQIGTAKVYKETLSSIKKFYGKPQLRFQDLNFTFLEKYDSFLRSNGGTDSGISFKMRTIKAVFNKAIKREIISIKTYPFKNYKTSALKKEAKKEYLTDEELQKLIEQDFSDNKPRQFAKDMYLFSFYCRGINFIDILKLKNSNIYDDRMAYTRTKTGVLLDFKVKNNPREILEAYSNKSQNSYLFPLLLQDEPTVEQIKNRSHKLLGQINPALKEIMEVLKINKRITFYTARHTFATFLKFENIAIDVISEMLGHKDIKATISYLNKLPNKKLDQIIDDVFANSKYF
ncbi:site-specific integrase [Flavobacterium sp.]|uniref:site-specific integrase n=1 Tax=Flavobacterium sp. TaxID=239 RepID=UPI002B7DDE2C|nr:site-specific integrase [Flavobacterium sp.]HSD07636.1 site-specific integrase [Flavobacterium sp.]